ncbi:MAG: Tpl protein [Candidatus Cloacimonetes bacterium]|nr:Tpl protein [Candidatus Cloacimonadota bacterium]
MRDFIEVEYRTGRIGFFCNPSGFPVKPEDLVIVDVERGEDIVQVIHLSISTDELQTQYDSGKISRIKRIATEDDIERFNNIHFEEEKAARVFNETLVRYPFHMKLIDTFYQFDGNKLTFFFSSEGRIDFRQFVRELATIFRTRIELHQTTGRDEAKRLGGFGMCGNQYCCGCFLKHFNQVTIKMAKDQNLAGNLSKISGPCGRLLCCLNFEEDFYVEEAKEFPVVGTCVKYKEKKMYVYKNDILNQRVHLTTEDQDLVEIELSAFKKLKPIEISDNPRCE